MGGIGEGEGGRRRGRRRKEREEGRREREEGVLKGSKYHTMCGPITCHPA